MNTKKWELILRFRNGHEVKIPIMLKIGIRLAYELRKEDITCRLKTIDNG